MKLPNFLKSIIEFISFKIIAKININYLYRAMGKPYYRLTERDHTLLKHLLSKNYYIILTYRRTHLTTLLIGIATLIKCGKWPRYTHALMNCENDETIDEDDFQIVEATGIGVAAASFMSAFDCDRVALIRPRGFDALEWTAVLDKLKSSIGKGYDTLFDLKDDTEVSCIELIRSALQASRDYERDFKHFENRIRDAGNLVPQMLFDSPDFEVVLEISR